MKAQESTARWAKIAGVLSGAALVALLYTLYLTRQANQIAINTRNRQLRSYLGIEMIKTQEIKIIQQDETQINILRPHENAITIQIELKNVGQTPTNKIFASINTGIADPNAGDPNLPEPIEAKFLGTIMPDGVRTLQSSVGGDGHEDWIHAQKFLMLGELHILSLIHI